MSSKSRPTLNVPKADSYLFLSSLSWVRSYATTTLESAGRRLPSGLSGGACDSRSFQRCCVTLVRCAAAAVLASSLRQRRGAVLASSLASGVARLRQLEAIMIAAVYEQLVVRRCVYKIAVEQGCFAGFALLLVKCYYYASVSHAAR